MIDRSPLLVAAAALIDAHGQVLIQRRPEAKHHGGLWEFPGGKLEPGETPPAALARELREELGIVVDPTDARPIGFAWRNDARPLVLLLFAVERWIGDPRAIEAPAIRWVGPEMLGGYPMPPADRDLCRHLPPAAVDAVG